MTALVSAVFVHSCWDRVPSPMGLGHFAFVAALYFSFIQLPSEQIPWVRLEIAVTVAVYLAMLIGHWQAPLAILPLH